MKTAKEVLIDARSLIAKPENWVKGEFKDLNDAGDPCYCALGAIRESLGGPWGQEVHRAALDALREFNPYGFGVATFNDAPETTHADVIRVFDKAIEKLDVTA